LLAANPHIRHFGDEQRGFADAAALCELMDVVVSVDTAVAHVAGALGRPTWILLNSAPDWRWMLGRDDSPWYPSVKLYRQQTLGDWAGVIERVAKDLQRL
jgi:ADP-heptose:LPS heptosyltransferase